MATSLNKPDDQVNYQTSPGVYTQLVRILSIFAIVRLAGALAMGTVATTTLPSLTTSLTVFGVIVVLLVCIALTFASRTNIAMPVLLIATLVGTSIVADMVVVVALGLALLVIDWRLFSVGIVAIFGLIISRIYQGITPNLASLGFASQINIVFIITLISFAVRFYVSSTQRTLIRAERDSELVRSAAEVGQIAIGIVSLDELLPRVVNFIRDRFGYYHVQIFLVDDAGEVAWLRASTGEVGQTLVSRGHHLNVGSNSVIGQVTQTGEIVIASDTDTDTIHYRNELLPTTRSELALPIRDGERVIGALDVQSQQRNAFPRQDLRSLQIMTNLLAASIGNAMLFEKQRQDMRDNQRLYIEAEANLQEIKRLNRQLTRESWNTFVEEQPQGVAVTLDSSGLQRTGTPSQFTAQASRTRQAVFHQGADEFTVAVPIILRGEVIGTMEIDADASLSEEDTIEIASAVSQRLAVSLDNARLFEETQSVTQYEQRVNNIVSKYQSVSTVDELLQVTLEELGETLGAGRGSIRLSTKFAMVDSNSGTLDSSNGNEA